MTRKKFPNQPVPCSQESQHWFVAGPTTRLKLHKSPSGGGARARALANGGFTTTPPTAVVASKTGGAFSGEEPARGARDIISCKCSLKVVDHQMSELVLQPTSGWVR